MIRSDSPETELELVLTASAPRCGKVSRRITPWIG